MEKPGKRFLSEEEILERRKNMTYTERFLLLMRLARISHILKNATITPSSKKS